MFVHNKDDDVQNKDITDVVILYSTWVRRIAKSFYVKYYAPGVELGDFIQYASVGLIESANRFNKYEPVRFTSFAYLRVKGTILNNIYKFSDAGHYIYSQYRREKERLSSLKRKKNIKNIDDYSTLVIDLAFSVLLEEQADDLFFEQELDENYSAYQKDENMQLMRELIGLLPCDQKKIMIMHYFQFISFTDIAGLMNVSKARVSQLHAKAISEMKNKMEHSSLYEF
ncbi:sigma-70 family RNA polymerase sigma factor [Photobacterium kasasachensis]|uniref:sigma-70 family RNA polymerase sigma factor n=1 Tax=Photobacterium kasasachensis TaxID=2910240 RepID=UPI003D0E2142